eukprot:scaffold15825_cov85-Skeletonema_dohrnii-CCMP3373.AAC.5
MGIAVGSVFFAWKSGCKAIIAGRTCCRWYSLPRRARVLLPTCTWLHLVPKRYAVPVPMVQWLTMLIIASLEVVGADMPPMHLLIHVISSIAI